MLTALLRRDLSIVFRARVTWWMAALSALVVGDGFVRSLQRQATDAASEPLEPLLRGVYVALCLFGPVVGARALAIEKHRRAFVMHLLQSRSITKVLLSKWIASTCGVLVVFLAVFALLGVWRWLVGSTGLMHAVITLVGYFLYAGYVACVGVAGAAIMGTFRGAVLLSLFMIGWNTAVDLSGTVSALSFMQSNAVWSPGTYLARFEHDELALGAITWLVGGIATGLIYAFWGCRTDLRGWRSWAWVMVATLICSVALWFGSELPGSWVFREGAENRTLHALPALEHGLALLFGYATLPCLFLLLGYGVFAKRAPATRAAQ